MKRRGRDDPGPASPRYSRFDLRALLARWLFVSFLLFAIYNPGGSSLYHWIRADFAGYWMMQIPAAILLSILGFLVLRATVLGLRVIGIALVTAALGSLCWVLSDLGWLDLGSRLQVELTVLLLLSGLLTAGVSSMHIWTRLSGQANIDDLAPGPPGA